MSTCADKDLLGTLQLPEEFEDLTGLIQADLRVIVSVLTQRSQDRLLLSRRQAQQFQRKLWDELTRAIIQQVEPLKIDRH